MNAPVHVLVYTVLLDRASINSENERDRNSNLRNSESDQMCLMYVFAFCQFFENIYKHLDEHPFKGMLKSLPSI